MIASMINIQALNNFYSEHKAQHKNSCASMHPTQNAFITLIIIVLNSVIR